jgi:xylose dehydrogenase (NAD/NADP)
MLRWGILGTARIARKLIPALRASSRSELVAVASRSLERARQFAAEWEIPRALQGYQELVEDTGLDVVYIPLPNGLHAEWSLRAARAGKHVLCEKPLALSLEDVDAMTATAQQAGVVLAEALMYRHHALTLTVKRLVDEGAIGRLRLVRGAFSFVLERADDVRWDPGQGGGSLWDVGCYPVGYARHLFGCEPEQAFGWQATAASGVDDVFTGLLRFPGDAYATFDSAFKLPHRMELELVGTQGVMRVPHAYRPGPRETLLIERRGSLESLAVSSEELYLGEVEDLAAAVLDGKRPTVSLADSRGNVATLVALVRSAREGGAVWVG